MGVMTTGRTSRGRCVFCGRGLAKAAMTRHLRSCDKRRDALERPGGERVLHILVSGRYSPVYWMHIAAKARATLRGLDGFLRRVWLECCGHLSAFVIDGESYHMDRELALESGRDMDAALGAVLSPGMEFYHEYDFGSTTELVLRVVSGWTGRQRDDFVVMARNDPPVITCDRCGEPAEHVCVECVYMGEGWLCGECSALHECGEEMLLPVVNSPRVGVCAYEG